jgi:hypothetical protein
MFGNGLVEVAIGMTFVYLLLSLISSVLNEWIAGLLGMRARNLEEGIRNFFTDGNLTAAAGGRRANHWPTRSMITDSCRAFSVTPG